MLTLVDGNTTHWLVPDVADVITFIADVSAVAVPCVVPAAATAVAVDGATPPVTANCPAIVIVPLLSGVIVSVV